MPTRRAAALAPLLASVVLSCPAGVRAGPWSLGLVQAWSHDSNLLRLADDTEAPSGYSRSDSAQTSTFFAGLDQPFGRQRGRAQLSLNRTRFDDNPQFDNDGYAASAGLDWSAAGSLAGDLNVGRSRSLSSFGLQQAGLLREKNLEDRRTLEGRLRRGDELPLMLEVDFDTLDTRNTLDDPLVRRRDFSSWSAAAGARWRPQGITTIGLFWRESRGNYPHFALDNSGAYLADRFSVRGADLVLSHPANGVSTLDLRLGRHRTRYDLNTARDFAGTTGSLAWIWRPTGKQTWTLNAARETGQDSSATRLGFVPAATDYSRVSHTLRLGVQWAATAKLAVGAGAARVERTLVQTIAVDSTRFDAGSGEERSDRLELSVRWQPYRFAQLGCEFARFRQRGSGLGESLHSSSANCSAQLILQ